MTKILNEVLEKLAESKRLKEMYASDRSGDNAYKDTKRVDFKKSIKAKLGWAKFRYAYMFGIDRDSRNNYMKGARTKIQSKVRKPYADDDEKEL